MSCTGITLRGRPCRNRPRPGGERCRLHPLEVSEAVLIDRVLAGGPDWRAAAWLLERGYPDRWGRPSRRVEAPAPVPSTGGDLDELRRRRADRRAGLA